MRQYYGFLFSVLEQSSTNPVSFFTSLLIHNLDNLSHLSINLIGLWIFGYIVSIQTNRFRMILIFILCGVLANISVEIFGNLLNQIFAPTFINWAISSGYYVEEGLRVIPSPSGGGASDGLTGLIGPSKIHTGDKLVLPPNSRTISLLEVLTRWGGTNIRKNRDKAEDLFKFIPVKRIQGRFRKLEL